MATMSDLEKPDYRVGYGRPPEHSRFVKGRSGNPNGRPRGASNFATELRQELSELILIKEDGKSRRLSKRRAMIKRLVQKALQGDAKSLITLLTLTRDHDPAPEREAVAPLAADDRAIINHYLARNRPERKP
jgi:hypothetical protein